MNRIETKQRTAVERIAWVLDDAIRIPGTSRRIGIDALLGLLPAGGDVIGGVLAGYTVLTAARLGAPPSVLARMGLNILVDTVIGTVPLLGDLFDMGWKANRRNVELLRRHTAAPAPVRTQSRIVVALVLVLLLLAVIGAAALSIVVVRWLMSLFQAA